MPNITSSKLKSKSNTVLSGAVSSDDEITNGLAFNLNTYSRLGAKRQAVKVRHHAGKMLIEFFLEWAMSGGTLKTYMLKRGWIKVPLHYQPHGYPIKQHTNS
ncbi:MULTISPECIES: hypothetical protein [unclassified Cytobacillus]|uniref:hypothetical protein n=1 Tax=unclassified Cytobacillus TaxID=2675268 RepID=UPI001356E123|nr:hypothetical protein [Cytobacillus sp. AMY 15.2]KAF0815907.1 hypothetical protein KIS4809_5334 [Bacillus sp. ZZV12-4809]MCM3092636.1 hypothetical protein [Cytobacillus sp. AMY 15.2]